MNLEPYPDYKDSGAEWLNEIPSNWRMAPLKALATCNDEVLAENTDPDYQFKYLEISDVSHTDGITFSEPIRFASAASRARRVVLEGDVLVSTVRTYLRAIAGARSVPADTIASTGFAVLRPNMCDARFLAYGLLAEHAIGSIIARSVGVSYPAINATDLIRVKIPLPSHDEQQIIADFLDRETAELDAFVADQEELIALLAERRTATITHAVTKGLDPDAPMKDSGVEWLDQVPLHWQVSPLRRGITYLTSGSRDWAALYADSGTPFVRIGNLTRGHLNLNMRDTQFVNVLEGTEGQRSSLKVNDVLFSITAYLGSVAVVGNDMEGAFISQHIALVRPIQEMLSARFLGYCVLSDWGQRQLSEQGYGGTKIQLSLSDIKRFVSTLPPRSEQEEIASYLDNEAEKIDAAIADAQEAITLTKERRAALISAAVTGKIDVRGLEAPVNALEAVSVGVA